VVDELPQPPGSKMECQLQNRMIALHFEVTTPSEKEA
jgi:hypothetical protein